VLVRIPAYLIKSHPEAKDIAVEALLKRFAETPTHARKKSVAIIGEIFPLDAMMIGQVLERIGVESVLTLPSQALEDYKEAGKVSVAVVLHPFYERVEHFYRERGVKVVAGNPVGVNSTYKWIKAIGDALDLDEARV